MALSSLFRKVSFDDLPGWDGDDTSGALAAFRRSAIQVAERPYRTGSLGVEFDAFAEAYADVRARSELTSPEPREFFERHFVPHKITPGSAAHGFVTGFYEPEVEASPARTDHFRIPLLARPDDLVDIDETNRPATVDPYLAFGRLTSGCIVEYHDRRAIECGALSRRGLEIAWLAEPVDAFFIHVQGAARLRMLDGSLRRVTYAAKSGHRFTGPGRVLADLGEIPPAEVTMQSIRRWFRDNPGRIDEILWRNRSYIFFRLAPVDDASLGPIAAAKVPLMAGRSIAVDRLLHTFGTPFFVDAPALSAFGAAPFRRLMIAQDTGSAITGPARGDLFAGSGFEAGEIAGVVRADADFYALIPRPMLRDEA